MAKLHGDNPYMLVLTPLQFSQVYEEFRETRLIAALDEAEHKHICIDDSDYVNFERQCPVLLTIKQLETLQKILDEAHGITSRRDNNE